VSEIVEATTPAQIEQVRALFREYRAELTLEDCFPSFDAEILDFPGVYGPPQGKLLLATVVGQPVGCVGLRPFPQPATCEMKRLYVRPAFRGGKVGRELLDHLLRVAKLMGYSVLRLDTHPPTMQAALAFYRKLGFREVAPDPLPPTDGLLYMELEL
jgi:putative acetyltransferase